MKTKKETASVKLPKPEFGRAMVVTAHPDDPEFLFGATVARLVAEGTDVFYLICSDGSNGGRDAAKPSEEIANTRLAEQRTAAKLLGVSEVIFLNFLDGRLTPSFELRREIAREIRRFKPNLVLTHFPRRALDIPIEASHPDHIAVGEATLSAIFPDSSNIRAIPELLDHLKIPELDHLKSMDGMPQMWRARVETTENCADLQARIHDLEARLKTLEKKLEK